MNTHLNMRLIRALRRVRLGALVSKSAAMQEAEATASSTSIPWWVRYTRWRPTSRGEAVAAEAKLLSLCRQGSDTSALDTVFASMTTLAVCSTLADIMVESWDRTPLELRDVSVGTTPNHTMHTILGGPEDATPLVLLPGYGAAAGFFFRNIDGLAQHFRVHAVDLLGTGMSGRPRFTAKSREEAEDFFLSALADWQTKLGLGKVVLVGHSLGGYLCATYALRHPELVKHVILVCPAGMATPPEAGSIPEWAKSPWTWRGQLFRLSRTLWDRGATPGGLVRTLGPWGPRIISGYARNRFKEGMGFTDTEVTAFENYFYHTTAARGSGEHALRHILGPFAWARHPLEGRLHDLKVPCSLIYGEHDWMDPKKGRKVFADLEADRGKLSDSDLKVAIIPDAGHYPFLDQPELFLRRLLQQAQPYLGKYPTGQKEITIPTQIQAEAAGSNKRKKMLFSQV